MSLECPSGVPALGLYPTPHLQVGNVFPFFRRRAVPASGSIGARGPAVMGRGMPLENQVYCDPICCMLRVWLIFMVPK